MRELIRGMYIKKYYVYEHYLDGNLIYVGKGSGSRAVTFYKRNKKWKEIVGNRCSEIEVKIIESFDCYRKAELFEANLIFENRNERFLANLRIPKVKPTNLRIPKVKPKMRPNERVKGKYVQKMTENQIAEKINKVIKAHLDKPLTAEDKEKLSIELNLVNKRNEIAKWVPIKKILIEEGYSIADKTLTIDGRRRRVSIITEL